MSIAPTGDMVHVTRWHWGSKEWSPFSATEMERRQTELRNHMAAESIDACLLTSFHNICYYSGWLYCYFGRKYGMVLDSENATTISAGIDGGQPWRRTYGDNVVYSDWRRENYYQAVRDLTPRTKRLGVELDHLSVDQFRALEAAIPGVELVDVGASTMWMRTVKSTEEHDLIRHGTRICDLGAAVCVDAVAAGVPEHEVALATTQAMVREIAASFSFVELMDTWTWFQSGDNTDGAHNPVTNKLGEPGDILTLNTFPMIFGYYTALERTLFCGHVTSDEHLRLWEVNVEVHERGLELIQPNARCCDIAAELNDIYRSYDLLKYRSFGYGHSFGVLSHYYGREAGVELREDVETVLEPGMVVSMEPMIAIPAGQPGSGGYREHDILIIGDDGAENITGFPYGPEHNIIGG